MRDEYIGSPITTPTLRRCSEVARSADRARRGTDSTHIRERGFLLAAGVPARCADHRRQWDASSSAWTASTVADGGGRDAGAGRAVLGWWSSFSRPGRGGADTLLASFDVTGAGIQSPRSCLQMAAELLSGRRASRWGRREVGTRKSTKEGRFRGQNSRGRGEVPTAVSQILPIARERVQAGPCPLRQRSCHLHKRHHSIGSRKPYRHSVQVLRNVVSGLPLNSCGSWNS
jgi:hypothetical protein